MDLIPLAYRQAHARLRRRRGLVWMTVLCVLSVAAGRWTLSHLIEREQAEQARLAPQLERNRADQNLLRELGEQAQAMEAKRREQQQHKGQLRLQALPEVLTHVPGGLQLEQIHLAPTVAAASAPLAHELHLRGQVPDNDSLRQALAHWREHAAVQSVELLNARPKTPDSPVLNFELRLSLPTGAASAAASGATP